MIQNNKVTAVPIPRNSLNRPYATPPPRRSSVEVDEESDLTFDEDEDEIIFSKTDDDDIAPSLVVFLHYAFSLFDCLTKKKKNKQKRRALTRQDRSFSTIFAKSPIACSLHSLTSSFLESNL